MISKEHKEKFLDLACALSPENLHMDGEATAEEARERLNAIQKEWRELEAEVGQKVTEDDAWEWHMKGEI
jgi:hypothetical protein